MILSASRRTDIPNYYSDWFFNRLQEGFLFVRNPYNPHQISRIDLSPETVDCIVFWTKNPEPILGRLAELEGPVARFDAVIAPHTHFRCTGCGAVLDLDLPYGPALDARAAEQGCTVTGHSLCFTGLCPQCGASAGTNS